LKSLLALSFALISLLGCSKNSLSERDQKLEKLKSAAETKRRELQIVAGGYEGVLTQSSGLEQSVSLRLDIKDIPEVVPGEVDPIMTPVLAGYLRFNVGVGIPFSIDKADFDPKRMKLDIVASEPDYKDILLSLALSDTQLDGAWSAPSSGSTGTIALMRIEGPIGPAVDQMAGEYGGVLYNDSKGLYQFGHITLSTTVVPPQGLKVTATVRVIFGGWASTEYLTYRFDPVEFNPMTGQMVLKNDQNDVLFSGYWTNGELKGNWFSSYTGKLGAFSVKKNTTPGPQPGTLFEALKGTYQGTIKNTNPASNLPERMMVSFVTSQDLSKPNGITVSGSLRLYIGPFGSTEYVEYPFSDIQFNFFTRQLTAKVNSEYKLTLKGEALLSSLSGTISADALGEVGTFEVSKQ